MRVVGAFAADPYAAITGLVIAILAVPVLAAVIALSFLRRRRRPSGTRKAPAVGAWEWNIQTGELVCSARTAEILGYRLADLTPARIEARDRSIHPDDAPASAELLAMHFEKALDLYECEVRLRGKNGSWIWTLEKGQVTQWTADGRPALMSGTLEDITERKQRDERILRLATHDVLTDLPNLRLARDRLAVMAGVAGRNGASIAVLLLDLDWFATINAACGHDAGDQVLREVGQRLRSAVRGTDTVARLGGDTFLLVLSEVGSMNDAAAVARKLIHRLSQPFLLPRKPVSLGASIGISFFPSDAEDIERLIRLAHNAMSRVKRWGRNGFSFAGKGGPVIPGFSWN